MLKNDENEINEALDFGLFHGYLMDIVWISCFQSLISQVPNAVFQHSVITCELHNLLWPHSNNTISKTGGAAENRPRSQKVNVSFHF